MAPMEARKSGFEDKFLSKLGKIDPRRVRDYLAHLLTRKNFFETIFDHLGEGVIVTDERQRILYTNLIAREILQWPARKHYLGETLAGRCPDGPLRSTMSAMLRVPRAMEGCEIIHGKDGERRLQLKAVRARLPAPDGPSRRAGDADSAEGMWVFILSDVTERRRRMEDESRSQRLASMALLTSGVAHEIKNPLNSLQIHAQILQERAREAAAAAAPIDASAVERATGVILEETERLTCIINDFIQAARPQGPGLERKYLNRIIEDIITLYGPECEHDGIELRTDLEAELPPVDMDANLMLQALRNLVRNAIEAHEEEMAPSAAAASGTGESKHRMILIRTRQSNGNVTIEIADNGPGIGEENIDKIFEPYYTTKAGGTGLGLMVVYRIITEHKGSIHVDSRPGLGTRFVISLPLVERPVRLLDPPESHGGHPTNEQAQ